MTELRILHCVYCGSPVTLPAHQTRDAQSGQFVADKRETEIITCSAHGDLPKLDPLFIGRIRKVQK